MKGTNFLVLIQNLNLCATILGGFFFVVCSFIEIELNLLWINWKTITI